MNKSLQKKIALQKRDFSKAMSYSDDIEVNVDNVFRTISKYRGDLPPNESNHILDNLMVIDGSNRILKQRYLCYDLNIAKNTISRRHPENSLQNEIQWLCKLLSYFYEDINSINDIKHEFEFEFLLGDIHNSQSLLNNIKKKYGTSAWLESSELSWMFFTENLKLHTDRIKEYDSIEDDLSKTILAYAGIKTTKSVSAERYVFSVGKMIEEVKLAEKDKNKFVELINFRHNFDASSEYLSLEEIIANESEGPLQDLYELLLKVLSHLYVKSFDLSSIKNELNLLKNKVNDRRLSLLVSNLLPSDDNINDEYEDYYLNATTAYLEENYLLSLKICFEVLNKEPTLGCFYELYIKSFLQVKKNERAQYEIKGVLGDILTTTSNILMGVDQENSLKILSKYQKVLSHYLWASQLNITLTKFNGGFSNEVFPYYEFTDATCIRNNPFSSKQINNVIKCNTKINIPHWRASKFHAEQLFTAGQYTDAIKQYNVTLDCAPEFYKVEITSKIIQSLHLNEQFTGSIKLLSKKIKNGLLGPMLPIRPIAERISQYCSYNIDTNELLDEVIILCEYNRCFTNKYMQDVSNICENILENAGIEKTEDLDVCKRKLPFYFFEKVLTLDVLKGIPTIFTSPLDMLIARHGIIRNLLDGTCKTNLSKRSVLLKENLSIISRVILNRCTTEIGSGKVYVERESIKTKLTEYVSTELKALQSISDKKFETIEAASDNSNLYHVSTNDFANKWVALVTYVLQEYSVDQVLGIDQSLNVGIRHGGMVNLLWGALKNNNLNADKQKDGKFLKNQQCTQDIKYYKDSIIKEVEKSIVRFNIQIDELISKAKKRVNVNIGELMEENTLFSYSFDLEYIQDISTKKEFYHSDLLLDELFSSLDSQTDEFLRIARDEFIPNLESEYLQACNNFKDEISQYKIEFLNQSIATVKREAIEKMDTLKSYFQWRGVSNTNFVTETAIYKAEEIIKNINPWSNLKVNIDINNSPLIFNGEHFYGFVTLFTLLFENVTKHSSNTTECFVSISMKIDNDSLTISCSNPIHNMLTDQQVAQIEAINERVNTHYLDDASKESGSGISKVKRIISHDLNLNNHLEISCSRSEFKIYLQLFEIDKVVG